MDSHLKSCRFFYDWFRGGLCAGHHPFFNPSFFIHSLLWHGHPLFWVFEWLFFISQDLCVLQWPVEIFRNLLVTLYFRGSFIFRRPSDPRVQLHLLMSSGQSEVLWTLGLISEIIATPSWEERRFVWIDGLYPRFCFLFSSLLQCSAFIFNWQNCLCTIQMLEEEMYTVLDLRLITLTNCILYNRESVETNFLIYNDL